MAWIVIWYTFMPFEFGLAVAARARCFVFRGVPRRYRVKLIPFVYVLFAFCDVTICDDPRSSLTISVYLAFGLPCFTKPFINPNSYQRCMSIYPTPPSSSFAT
jgi:hypothetical protein